MQVVYLIYPRLMQVVAYASSVPNLSIAYASSVPDLSMAYASSVPNFLQCGKVS